MRLPRLLPTIHSRQILAAAVVFAQVIAATGAPVFVTQKPGTSAEVPHPCQGHACACATSEQSWTGDCCCFTLEEKLAWAETRGIEPPEHVRPLVAERAAAKKAKSCCSKPKKRSCCAEHEPKACSEEPPPPPEPSEPKLKWVVSVFAQKCRGDGPAGLLELGASIAPVLPSAPREPRPARDFDRPTDTPVRFTSFQPPIPPPRAS
jgi:hypothetical protein